MDKLAKRELLNLANDLANGNKVLLPKLRGMVLQRMQELGSMEKELEEAATICQMEAIADQEQLATIEEATYEEVRDVDFDLALDSDDDSDIANDNELNMDWEPSQMDSTKLTTFRKYVAHATKHFAPFTEKERKAIRLLDMLRKKKCPLDTFDGVMEWHLRESGGLQYHQPLGDAFGYVSRKTLLKKLKNRYNRNEELVQSKTIILPHSGTKVDVIYKDARDCIVNLLTDPRFKYEDFLFFNDDPLAPPPDNLQHIGDINTGLSYIETYKQRITNPNRQMLVPTPLYIDGAVTGQYDKLEVCALKMALGIHNRRARDQVYAWETLGWVPNYNKETSRGKKIFSESNHIAAQCIAIEDGEGEYEGDSNVSPAQDKHTILSCILESYAKMAKEGMVWDFEYKGKVYKEIELLFFIPFVKCDSDEADTLTGKYKVRNGNVECICRYCDCPTEDSDNPLGKYRAKTEPWIRGLVERNNEARLKRLSQHRIKNAFHGLPFGLHNQQGIHGACPMELLHAILLGIYMYMRNCFFKQMGKSSRVADKINALAQTYGSAFAHQSDRDMPKTKFAKGIQKGKIMAKEYSGVMLVMAAIIQSSMGRKLLKEARTPHFKEDYLIHDWQLAIETVLEWEAFLKLDEMNLFHVKRLKRKHKYVMYLIKKVANRTEGMGMKLLKFHAIMHMALDIINFAVPNALDTGSNESHHKLTKVAAKLTQRMLDVFEKQTAQRLEEFTLIDLAMEEIDGRPLWEYYEGKLSDVDDDYLPSDNNLSQNSNDSSKATTGGTEIEVFKDEEGEIEWDFVTKEMRDTEDDVAWDPFVVDFLFDVQEHLNQYTWKLKILTEHKRNGQIFRGHPNFRQNGRWNDWVIVDWGSDYGAIPAEIWCFIDLTDLPDNVYVSNLGGINVKKGVYAVVESTFITPEVDNESNDPSRQGSDIFTPILKEVDLDEAGNLVGRTFYLADVEAFVDPVVVIPDIGADDNRRYFTVEHRAKWSEIFINWLEAEHSFDDME